MKVKHLEIPDMVYKHEQTLTKNEAKKPKVQKVHYIIQDNMNCENKSDRTNEMMESVQRADKHLKRNTEDKRRIKKEKTQ